MTVSSQQTEPSAIWSTRLIVFDKALSLTQNVVLSQGRFALSALIKKIDQLYSNVNSFLPQLMDMYPHPDIPDALSDICLHQGIASNIMFNSSDRSYNESATAYKLRMERFDYVKGFCEKERVSTVILSNKKVRNQLVHIDDYLVKALRKQNTGWVIDSAIAYRNQLIPPDGISVGFCRTFIASEEIILHLDNEISVRDLRAEATAVLAVVFGVPPTEPPQAPSHSRQGLPPQPPQTRA